jgi:hypothetical protein
MSNVIKYMLVVKQDNNSYRPLEWQALHIYNNEDLSTLEGIDAFTSKVNSELLIKYILEEALAEDDDLFQEFIIIYKEKGKYREVKEGVIFNTLAPFVTDQSIINLININYQDKDLLNYIINILSKNIEDELHRELIFILKNLPIFEAKGKNAIKAALDKYKELDYKEKRSLAINIYRKLNN